MNNMLNLNGLKEGDKLRINFLDNSGVFIKVNYSITTMRPDDTCYEEIPVFDCIAIDAKGRKIGTLNFEIPKDTELFLGGVDVDERARRYGVGTKMLEFVDMIATAKGVDRIDGYYGNQGRHVDSFYSKNGYVIVGENGLLHVRKKVNKRAVFDDMAVSVNGVPVSTQDDMEL